MVFNSLPFLAFLPAVVVIYFILRSRWQWQNIVLLVASYVSYGFWDQRFLALVAGMTVINYAAGWAIGRPSSNASNSSRRKRAYLVLAIAFDLCVLGAFKYFNFFDDSLVHLLSLFGVHIDPVSLKIILPLGLSFYTFQAITYPFDIYRGKIAPTRRFLDFALFVSFFPTVVSGPIERASHLLPQFSGPRDVTSDKVNEGLWLIMWGFFQKMVIADNIGLIVNQVYGNYTQYHGLDIVIAVLAYTVQILADFGGYTDIARGVARLFGFDLLLNFNVPYFAINPSDFWSRWHISLSSWFRDYVYVPLGGNRKGGWRTSLNLLVTMVLCGLWHGAAWTFVIWGAWHGLLLVVYRLSGKAAQSVDRTIKDWRSVISIGGRTALMVVLVAAGWAVFRATSFSQVAYLFSHLGFSHSDATLNLLLRLFCFTLPLVIVQIFQWRTASPVFTTRLNAWARGVAYGCIVVGIIVSQREITHFIYQGF